MKKRFLTGLLAVTFVASALSGFALYRRWRPAVQPPGAVETRADNPAKRSAEPTPSGDQLANLMQGLMKHVLDNPAFTEMNRRQTTSGVKTTYLPLFEKLRLSEPEREKLTALLAAQETAQATVALRMFTEGMNVENLDALPDEVQTATDEAAKEIKSFLGDRRFAEYENFTETLGYRVSLGKARERMASKGVPLTREQEEFLIGVLREEDAQAGPLELTPGSVGDDNEAFSAETLTQQVEERDRRILKRAGDKLSEEQLEVLAAAQGEDREVMTLSATIGQTIAEGLFPGFGRDATE